jgi:hypothetical protein
VQRRLYGTIFLMLSSRQPLYRFLNLASRLI